MPGAGKTTVGERLAARLQVEFYDCDREIEQTAGMTIAEFFARDGETAFRAAEAAVIARLVQLSAGVIALGGGALQNDDSFNRIHAAGILAYLRLAPGLLVRRNCAAEARPLLADCATSDSLQARLAELLAARQSRYLSAEIIVDVSAAMSPDAVAAQICDALETR